MSKTMGEKHKNKETENTHALPEWITTMNKGPFGLKRETVFHSQV